MIVFVYLIFISPLWSQNTHTVSSEDGRDFTTIQEAIDSASVGDTIKILFMLSKKLSLIGRGDRGDIAVQGNASRAGTSSFYNLKFNIGLFLGTGITIG